MAQYSEVSSDVVHMVETLIKRFHSHLSECNIGLVFRDVHGSSGGRAVLAKTSKIPEKIKPHLQNEDLDIIIEIALDKWQDLEFQQRQALLDHELCHIALGSNGWTIEGHDFEEFHCIIQRWGLWNYSLLSLEKSMSDYEQLRMTQLVHQGEVIALAMEDASKVGAEDER